MFNYVFISNFVVNKCSKIFYRLIRSPFACVCVGVCKFKKKNRDIDLRKKKEEIKIKNNSNIFLVFYIVD